VVLPASDIVRPDSRQAHLARVYRDEAELATAVGSDLDAALQAGGSIIVVATESHGRALNEELERRGWSTASLEASGRLVALDAEALLGQFMSSGGPDGRRFRSAVADLIGSCLAQASPVVVFGEMVAVLWDKGQVTAACELEHLWNELLEDLPFALVCGYPASARLSSEAGWGQVCQLHGEVLGPEVDTAVDRRWRLFGPVPEEAREARRFVGEVLREWSLEELYDDAALVIAELATNAVVHARTGFTVEMSLIGGGVRIAVSDTSPGVPMPRDMPVLSPSGRGLALIEAMAQKWGTELLGERKVVWAELRG
jgi:hypothetical protein